jgi:ubiquinone biosynthesis protein UbiJ
MSEHHSSHEVFNLANARVPIFQWISIVGMIVSLAIALSSRLTSSDRTAVDLAKLQGDVTEMRKQMAGREDVSDLSKQVRELEIQVAKLTDRLERPK